MNHSEWVVLFKEAMQLSSDDPRRASAMLLKLAEQSKHSAKHSMSDWHEQQAVSSAATLLEEAGDLDESFRLYRRMLDLCKGWAIYWTKATAHTFAVIALSHFRAGRDDDGISAAQEALRYLGREPEADTLFTELIQELHQRQEKHKSCSPA